MHCGNTTFIYHNDFSKYMKVDGATSNDVFDYLFNLKAGKFLSEKKRNICINYLISGIQSTLKMMKILMTDLKTILEMKACKISRITNLFTLKNDSTSI